MTPSLLKRKRWKQVVVALVVLSTLIGLPATGKIQDENHASGGLGPDYPPPTSGDWVITGDTSVWDGTITLNGSLIITGTGKLTLANCTLKMNSTSDGQYKIQVNTTGELHAYNSTLTAYNTAYKYRFEVYGRLWTNHSIIEYLWGQQDVAMYAGGVQVYGAGVDVWLNDTKVWKSWANGIHAVNAVGVNITYCNITDNARIEIYIQNCQYVNISHTNVTDYTDLRPGDGIHIDDASNIDIYDCMVASNPAAVMDLDNLSYSTIRYCDLGFGVAGPNPVGVIVRNSNTTLRIAWNNVSGCTGIELNTNASPIIEFNNLFDNDGSGVYVFAGSHLYLYNNTIGNNSAASGVNIRNSNATLINNTLWNDIIDMYNSYAWIEDCYIPGTNYLNASSPFIINSTFRSGPVGQILHIKNDSHPFALNCTADNWDHMIVEDTSNITVQNFLHVIVFNSDGFTPVPNAWVNVTDNGIQAYSGQTDINGEVQWVAVTNRTYHQDYWDPFHPFTDITYNETAVTVEKGALVFDDNPRIVGMDASHWEVFQALNSTLPTVTYVVPPTPPNNTTRAVGQSAFIRAHYYNNDNAAVNATLFWKNASETSWHWQSMANISFWNGSYNNYFEANFTESSPTAVTYYVNCTSSANLTTMAPIRTMNFANISVNDPYPIYGYVYLYNGNGGVYNPIPLANAQVDVTWWNVWLNDWQTITTSTIGTGQYSVDLMNYTNGGVVFCNATAPATFNNRGYNWTIVDVAGAPGGRQQDIVCGVPYNLEITNYPLSTPVNTPFGITYEIQDIDENLCQGYYSFFDGTINISANGSYNAPADYTFDGLLSATPGTRTETITLGLPLGQRWLNVSEGLDLNPYLTPWGAFYNWNGTAGFLKDWDNVTINVTGAGFLWRLEEGWNLICVPASPVQKGGNGIFDSYDAMNITYAITGDPGMSIANRTGGNPSAYSIFDYGMPENLAFPMDGVHGYWLYLSAPGPFVVNVTAQNYSAAGANVANLAVGWNLLGFTHNISSGGAQPGGWNSLLTASHFTNGNVDSDLNLPPRNKLVITWWDPIVQWYHSYVVTPTFPGMPTHDWAYDTTYAYGYWIWTDAVVQVSFNSNY